jgi:hypothetical protein
MKVLIAALCTVMALAAAPVPQAVAQTPAQRATSAFERDRAAILAMAGDYRVRFDFRETVSFVEGYTPLPPTGSGGFEAVRVIEDRGDFISLQHMLVVGEPDELMVVKHWRQDWTYQPTQVLAYAGKDRWRVQPVSADQRRGAWSQTVWQTDDSPRYGGVGRWTYDGGVTRWTSESTRRPLARRDAIRKPPYSWYEGVNRHAFTPTGWVHEQDNDKLGVKDGRPVTFVHEVVLNTYRRSTEFKASAADDYWAKTKDYWGAVRASWDQVIKREGGVAVAEEANNGSITGPRLMTLADEIDEGKITTQRAADQARRIIAEETARASTRASR